WNFLLQVPWSKSGLSSSYTGPSSSSSYGSSKLSDSGLSSSTSQYDGGGGYTRRLSSGSVSSSPSSSSYLSRSSYTPSYLSSSYGRGSTSSYLNSSSSKDSGVKDSQTSSEREEKKENERKSLLDKYTSGTYPGRRESYSTKDKEESDTGSSSYRGLGRSISAKSNRDISPEPSSTTNSDLGSKSDRVGYTSSLSPYRLYSRNYSRSNSRDSGPESSSSTSTPATTPVHAPTSLRFSSSTRYGSSIIRSPVSEKPPTPTIFGLSSLGYSSRSVSRSNSQLDSEEPKSSAEVTPAPPENATPTETPKEASEATENKKGDENEEEGVTQTTFITVVTRGTSPTPPSSYVRSRRAELARVLEKTIAKPKSRPEMVDKEIQSDRGDDTARLSRYGVSSRWASYLDRYPSAASSYSPVSRYSSRYSYTSSRGDKDSKDEKESPSRPTDATESSTTSDTSKYNSISHDINKDIKKDSVLTGRTLQSSPINSAEKKLDSLRSELTSLKSIDSKPQDKIQSVTKTVENQEVSRIVNKSDESAKTKPDSIVNEKSKESVPATKIEEVPATPTGLGLTRVKSVKSIVPKPDLDNSATDKTSGVKMKTSVSSEKIVDKPKNDVVESKVLPETEKEGSGLTRVKSVKNMASKPPMLSGTESPVVSRSRRSSATSLSSEVPSEKPSGAEETKSPQDCDKELPVLTRVKSFKSIKSGSQSGSETPVGLKSKSSSSASLASEGSVEKSSLAEESVSKSETSKEITGLSRNASSKSLGAKPPVPSSGQGADTPVGLKSKSASSASLNSEGAQDKTSKEGILSRTSSGEGSLSNTPSHEACLSKTSSNEGLSTKTVSTSSYKISTEASNKLPPPVPKSDGSTGLKTSSSMHSLSKLGVGNKDFRKSPLNVELTNALQAEAFKKLQEKQRQAITPEKKFKRSISASSGDSEPSCTEIGSTHSLISEVENSSSSLKTGNSLSKLHSSSSASKLLSSNSEHTEAFSKRSSIETKPQVNVEKGKGEPSGSSTESSSSESTSCSSESSSSSEDEDEGLTMKRLNNVERRRRRRSPSITETQQTSILSSSADEMSLSIDKPPKPPSSPKPNKEESKSFLMRALAPVTNLFRGKQDSSSTENLSDGMQRTASNQSLNKSDKEDVSENKLENHVQKDEKDANNADKESSKLGLKYKLKKNESGERAWWLESNPNIPEGIKRIESNTSINKIKDIETDTSKMNGELPDKSEGIKKTPSASSLAKSKDQDGGVGKPPTGETIKRKIHRIRHQQSGEIPWWLDSGAPVPEGVKRNESSSSINKLQDSDQESKKSEGVKSLAVQKSTSNVSLNKEKDSDPDSGKPPTGEDKVKRKIHKIKHQQSGELPWWLDNGAPLPEGVKRIESNSSINKLVDSDADSKKSESATESSISEKVPGVKKTSSGVSLNKSKDSDQDVGKPPTGDDKAKRKLHKIRHQQSGELPWWLDNSAAVPEGVKRNESNSSVNKLLDSDGDSKRSDVESSDKSQGIQKTSSSSSITKSRSSDQDVGKPPTGGDKTKRKLHRIRHQPSGELPWWLDNNATMPEGVQRIESNSSVNKLLDSDADGVQRVPSNASINKLQDSDTDSKKSSSIQRIKSNTSVNKLQSSDSDSKKSGETEKPKKKVYKIRHHDSGDLPWWQDERAKTPEGVQRIKSSHSITKMQDAEKKAEENKNMRNFGYKIRKQESGEKAWWLSSSGDIPDGVKKLTSSESSSESEEDENQKEGNSGSTVPKFPLVLPKGASNGDRSGNKVDSGRHSPYDNLQQEEERSGKTSRASKSKKPLFIGAHTNIDDILGTAATLVNPVMGLSRLRKKHEGQDAVSSNDEGGFTEFYNMLTYYIVN
ncbi:hypothetical protein C0J52_00257, partial [Blattella germanica]